jgi:hypothetical protein
VALANLHRTPEATGTIQLAAYVGDPALSEGRPFKRHRSTLPQPRTAPALAPPAPLQSDHPATIPPRRPSPQHPKLRLPRHVRNLRRRQPPLQHPLQQPQLNSRTSSKSSSNHHCCRRRSSSCSNLSSSSSRKNSSDSRTCNRHCNSTHHSRHRSRSFIHGSSYPLTCSSNNHRCRRRCSSSHSSSNQ